MGTIILNAMQGGSLQKGTRPPEGRFFKWHGGACPGRYSWQAFYLKYGPVLSLLLAGKPANAHAEYHVKCAIKWWNRQLTAHIDGNLSSVQVGRMNAVSPEFEFNPEKLRLDQPGYDRHHAPANRRDYLGFATNLADCLEHPEKTGNKIWLEVLRYRYRAHQLDCLQESMVETAYPGFCTEKAILEEKCRHFEETLQLRLSDQKNPTNQNWLYNHISMARNGAIHPDYIKIMKRYDLIANRLTFASFMKKYVKFKQKHGEPRRWKGAKASELRLVEYANGLREKIRSDPGFPAWETKQLLEAGFPAEIKPGRKASL